MVQTAATDIIKTMEPMIFIVNKTKAPLRGPKNIIHKKGVPKKASCASSPKSASPKGVSGPSKKVLLNGLVWKNNLLGLNEDNLLVPVIFGDGAKETLWDFKTIRKRTSAPVTELPLACKFGAGLVYKITDLAKNRGMFKLSWPSDADEEGYFIYVARQNSIAQHSYSRCPLCD
jgi:hypothetical protein